MASTFSIFFIDERLEHVTEWYVDSNLPLPAIPRPGDEFLHLGRSYEIRNAVWRDRFRVDIYLTRIKKGKD